MSVYLHGMYQCTDQFSGQVPPFDGDAVAARLKLSPKQRKLADGVLAGLPQYRAAEIAGYSAGGSKKTLGSAASAAVRSRKVQRYLAAARQPRDAGALMLEHLAGLGACLAAFAAAQRREPAS